MPSAPPSPRAGLVLIVEDDEPVRAGISAGLKLHGFRVLTAANAESALISVARRRPDLLVVDVGLPGMSGIELCVQLRDQAVETPILVLSARDQVGDRVAGLHAGADDYLVKPFALDELVARLNALQRRAGPTGSTGTLLSVGSLWIDVDRRSASMSGSPLDLTRREFDLLVVFATNPGIVLSRLRLLELVWGYDFEVDTNVVDVFVGYLRRKLEAMGVLGLIETVRGVGFRLVDR
ncbi:MAG: response regulator transcription factor [Actinomycetota bacterium]